MDPKKNKSVVGETFACIIAVLFALFLDGCSHHISPEPLVDPAIFSQPNVKVHWNRPEFLYTDALDAPIEFPINPDGTLVPPMSRADIDEMQPIPAQFETSIGSLTASPDHRSIYLRDSTDPTNRLRRYRVGRQGVVALKQALIGGNNAFYPMSMAFAGRERFLYVVYDQYNASQLTSNHYMLMAYRFVTGGKVERLPTLAVVAATYTTAAYVAKPIFVPAYAVTGPSIHFLYVVRPEDHYLDVYQIKPSGALLAPPAASLALGYRAGKSVFISSGRILCIADADHACIKQYQIGTNGVPALLPGTVPGTDPTLDPCGRFLYAAASGNHALLCYHVLSDGTLRPAGATATHDLCFAPCVDATGRFVYAMARNLDLHELAISQFRITSNGTLVPLQPEEVPAVASTTLVTAQ